MTDNQDRDQRNPLDRVLGLFTEVRAGESGLALAMMCLAFLVLACYYLIKPVRDALMLQQGGAEAKTYMQAVTAVLLFFLVQGYAKLVSRYERTRLITVVTSVFIGCLVGFWALGRIGVPNLSYVLYVWASIFAVMVVSQFWSYANDVYSNEAGKRLFPIVGFGGVTGSFVGAAVARRLVEYINVFELLLVAAGVLAVCIVITNLVSLKVWGRQQIRVSQSSLQDWLTDRNEKKEREKLAFGVLKEHKYLWYIALSVLILNLVNTTGEYVRDRLAVEHYAQELEVAVAEATSAGTNLRFGDRDLGDPRSEDAQDDFMRSSMGRFFAGFFLWVNLLAMFLQLLVVGRLIKHFGVKGGLLWLPLIALGSWSIILFVPLFNIVRIGKTVENASDYSINNTARNMLFLPTSRDVKYKAKQVIDSFFHRLGDVASALVVFVGTVILHSGIRGFAVINLAIIAGWFLIVRGIVGEYREIEAGNRPELTGETEEEQAA